MVYSVAKYNNTCTKLKQLHASDYGIKQPVSSFLPALAKTPWLFIVEQRSFFRTPILYAFSSAETMTVKEKLQNMYDLVENNRTKAPSLFQVKHIKNVLTPEEFQNQCRASIDKGEAEEYRQTCMLWPG